MQCRDAELSAGREGETGRSAWRLKDRSGVCGAHTPLVQQGRCTKKHDRIFAVLLGLHLPCCARICLDKRQVAHFES